MDRESVLAKCHLHAVLPLLEELCAYDAEAKNIISNWEGTIQFSCPGGFGEYLEFSGGKAKAYRGTVRWPTVALWFVSPGEMNKLFTGEGFTIPVPWKGLTNLGMLKGFIALTKRLDFYLRTEEDQMPVEHHPFLVKLKLYTAIRAIKEVGENDPHVTAITDSLPAGIVEVRVAGDGPAAHLRIRNGIIMPDIGRSDSPNAVMEFSNNKIASGVFNDKIDAMAAIGTGEIKLLGNIAFIDSVNVLLDRVGTYLS